MNLIKKPVQVHKQDNEGCEIEVKRTSNGKRIRFRGKCSKEQLRMLAHENGLDVDE